MDDLSGQIEVFIKEVERKMTDPDEVTISPEFIKNLYEKIRHEDKFSGLPESEAANDEICIDGFDAEGIFQQLKHYNTEVLPLTEDAEAVNADTLSARVFMLDNALKSEGFSNLNSDEGVEDLSGNSDDDSVDMELNDPESGVGEDDDHAVSDEDLEENYDHQLSEDSDVDEEGEDENESEESAEEKEAEDLDEENPFGSDIDFDADTFGDIKLDENEDDEESDDEMKGFEDIETVKERERSEKKKKKKSKSTKEDVDLDSDMFDKDVEVDEDLLDALYDSDEEGAEGDGDAVTAKFADFFESAESYEQYVKDALKKQNQDENNDDAEKLDEEDSKSEMAFDVRSQFEVKSTFEEEREKEKKIIESMEEKNIATKPWYLTGEVTGDARPQGSAVEEFLEKKLTLKHQTDETDDFNNFLEKTIIKRFRNKAFDDVEQVEKATVDLGSMKKKLEISSEKSQKSLADLYAEDYAKTIAEKPKAKVNLLTGKEEDSHEEDEQKQKFKNDLDADFAILDALYNYHYTATMPDLDIKVVNLTPAITMEEATPITASDATILAPEEIFKAPRGDLTGKTERNTTDRKRERRRKKARQHRKAVAEEDNVNKQLKTRGDDVASTSASLKFVQKALKNNQIHALKVKPESKKSNSTNFFKSIQEKVAAGVKTKKRKATFADTNAVKKKKVNLSAKKILL